MSGLPVPSAAEASGNVDEPNILRLHTCLNETSGKENARKTGTKNDDLHLLTILQGLLLSVQSVVVNKRVICKR